MDLQSIIPNLWSISTVYFPCPRKISSDSCHTSNPKKKCKAPRSFISNSAKSSLLLSEMRTSSPVRKSCSSNVTILLLESALLWVKPKAHQKAICPAKTCLECLQDFSSTCSYEISSHETQHTKFVEQIFPYKFQAFFCRVIHCPGWLYFQGDLSEWLILYHTEFPAPSVSRYSAPSETDHPTVDWICHHFLVCFSYKSHSVH